MSDEPCLRTPTAIATTVVSGVTRDALETTDLFLARPPETRVFACGSLEAMAAVQRLCRTQETEQREEIRRALANFNLPRPTIQRFRPDRDTSMFMAYGAPPPPEDWEP